MIFDLLRRTNAGTDSGAPSGGALGAGTLLAEEVSAPGIPLAERVRLRLAAGATIQSIAAAEGVSEAFVSVMVDDFERRGLAVSANSLCASGLGACGTGSSPEVALQCIGCPLAAPKS